MADKKEPGPSAFESMVGAEAPLGGGDLAIPEEAAPLAVGTAWTQDPEFEAGEVGFPKLRLGQGLTPEVAERQADIGDWLLTGQTPFKSITVIPIMFSRTRSKRADPNDRESPVACQSGDAKVGVGDPGMVCKECPFSKWQPGGPNGKNRPPACVLTYRYAVWVVEGEAIAEISFQKTSEQYAYLINNLVQRYGFGKFAVKLTSTIKKGNNRIWAEPQVTLAKLTPDMLRAAGSLIPGNEYAYEGYDAPEDAAEITEIVDSQAVPV